MCTECTISASAAVTRMAIEKLDVKDANAMKDTKVVGGHRWCIGIKSTMSMRIFADHLS